MAASPEIATVLAGVGGRLRQARARRGVTLTDLAAATGISKSTLSRLESGQRKPSLELLLPIAKAHRIPLDELVGAPDVGDPRIQLRPQKRGGRVVVPLTQNPSGIHAWKVLIPPERKAPVLRTHEGNEWLYVLSGELRLLLGGHDLTLTAGEVAEFDRQVPHWFGAAGERPVEILSLLGKEGERAHIRAAPRRGSTT
jgi:transcriptional regulator with XRE-family HTH domain